MHSITITLGRNVGDTPMSHSTWQGFKRAAKYALNESLTYGGVIETHEGVGVWDGKTEESAKITQLLEGELHPWRIKALRERLEVLAGDYGQDAIALTIGQGELIMARVLPDAPISLGPISARLGRLLTPGQGVTR